MATSLIDCWAHILSQNYFYGIPGAILSFNTLCTGSFVIIMLLKSNKQVEGKIRNFKLDQRKVVVKQGKS